MSVKIIHPDLILMDVDMPVLNGIQATKIIKQKYPEIKIIALTIHNELGIITKLKENGIDGYLLKNTTQSELVNAIRIVFSGANYFSSEITNTLLNSFTNGKKVVEKPIPSLTQRELVIIKLIAQGLSNTEIGTKLFISPRTVDTHRTNLMKKIKVTNIAGLIKFAFRMGLVE